LIFICFTKCSHLIALLVFLGVWMTDMLDGMAARKLCATSKIGAYADVIADFILMISAFLAFFKLGWYSIFMLLPIGVSFVQNILDEFIYIIFSLWIQGYMETVTGLLRNQQTF